MTGYYPLVLDLADRRCVVIGGGTVAERKVYGLLAAHAIPCVISPRATWTLRQSADEGRITLHEREMLPADLDDADLIIAATGDVAVNTRRSGGEKARRVGQHGGRSDEQRFHRARGCTAW